MVPIQDEDDQLDGESVAAPAPDLVGPPEPAAPIAAPTPINPMVAAYLKNKQDMAAAQETASKNQLLAGLARAGGTFAHGISGAKGPMNETGYDALDKNAQAPVQNMLAGQKSAAEESQNQGQMQTAQKQSQDMDADSDASKSFRGVIQGSFPKLVEAYAAAGVDFNKVTAADAPNIMKIADTKAAIDQRAEASKDRAALMGDRATTKATADQAKAYTEMTKALQSFRGNQSAQQAAVAVLNADKAIALVKSSPTSQNLALLADEMGKVAMGGVPGEHGVQALAPNTLYTKIAEIKSFLSGNPTPADVAGFLKNNEEYLNTVKEISKKTIYDYKMGLAKGYKKRVAPDDYQEALNEVESSYGPSKKPPDGTIQVRRKTDGKVGSMPAAKFNPDLYDKVQ